jgi:hypothetical protein
MKDYASPRMGAEGDVPPRNGKGARQGAYPEGKNNTTKETDTAFLADSHLVVKRRVPFCFSREVRR